jgi:Domain of unknown function (DUF4271)
VKLFLRFYKLKHLTAILFFSLWHVLIFAQDTGNQQKPGDTSIITPPGAVQNDSLKNDSLQVKKPVKKVFVKKDSGASAQVINISDSSKRDSLKQDSLHIDVIHSRVKKEVSKKNIVHLMPGVKKDVAEGDIVFYILIFLIFFLGLVRTSFPRYFDSIFTLSFQATFRQAQTREQMGQNFFPAFMLNVLFVLCGGLFITLFARFNSWSQLPLWQLFVYSTAILLFTYLIKYIVISFTGWVFNAKDAAGEYRFVVFLINKLLGVLMIPLLFLIAYADNNIKNIAATIVICLIIFSLAVRYLVSLARIRRNLSITVFHFFIYLCAVEIMPLLVIYKVLFPQTSNR